MPGLTHDIKYKSQLHDRIAYAVRDRITASKNGRSKFIDRWSKAEEKAQAYLPEREVDAVRRTLREGGKPQYTTIQIPYTFALLMTAHTYFTTVFLGRNPIFQFQGRHGEGEMQIQATEAYIDYQLQVGMNLVPLFIWLYDAPKYGHGILALHWEEQESIVSEIVEIEDVIGDAPIPNTKRKLKQARRIKGYHGNKLSNIRPLDFFPDPRYPLHEFQKGEFCAVLNSAVQYNRLVELQEKGRYVNVELLKRRGVVREREEGSRVSDLPDSLDFSALATEAKLGSDSVELFECYIELIPNEWGLGTGKLPEKWVFTVSSDYTIVIGAQPLGAYHNKFPFAVLEMEPEGYALFNRALSDIVEPLQNTIDWLINSHFYNVRKTLNNQWVGDPSRLVMKDIENPLPGGFVRLAPAAYGQDPKTVITQLPVQDLTKAHIGDLGLMMQLGEKITGITESVMGISNPSSRRSAAEVRSTNTFAVSRLKTTSEFFSALGFSPLAQMMVQNSQQYYDQSMKLRLVGDLAPMAGNKFLDVTPELIHGFYDFVPVDGTLPADRFAQASLWTNLLAQLRNLPQVAAQYDLGKIFAWVAQLAGLKNINQFRIEVVPDQMLLGQSQQGSVIPIRQPGQQPLAPQIPGTGQV